MFLLPVTFYFLFIYFFFIVILLFFIFKNNIFISKAVKVRNIHCTKNHISQVLEYNEKLENTKKISTFHQLFRSKRGRISYLWKVRNRNFCVLKKHSIPCWRKYHLISTFESKDHRLSHLWKVQNKNFSVFRKHGIPC